MVDAGCDVIEVGLPYSDPVMDGPTIQAAAQQALERGIRTADVLRMVEAVAATGTPDPGDDLLEPGRAATASSGSPPTSRNAGGAGLITPDLTPDVAPDWIAAADAHDLDKVFLVAPSSTDERIAMTTAACRGFVYATAIMGVTGTTPGDRRLGRARWSPGRKGDHADLPVGVGRRCQHRRPGGRGRRVRRRRDRRLRRSCAACWTPDDRAPACAR